MQRRVMYSDVGLVRGFGRRSHVLATTGSETNPPAVEV